MTPIGQPERATQERVIALFRDELRYRYLGDWADRPHKQQKIGHLPGLRIPICLFDLGFRPFDVSPWNEI